MLPVPFIPRTPMKTLILATFGTVLGIGAVVTLLELDRREQRNWWM